ncbi:MAG: acylphosphatase [Lachnospiraceae bacterium]|nr:acylphosphatase [Lachnospiraceae bacterium]
MSLKKKIIEIRDNYVINQVKAAQLPEFRSMEIRRYRLTFYGRVQNVGFRLEVTELAKRLGLTGYCNNQENGSVIMEVQGQFDKIKFLVAFMKSLKRIVVKRVDKQRLPLDFTEVGFVSDDED